MAPESRSAPPFVGAVRASQRSTRDILDASALATCHPIFVNMKISFVDGLKHLLSSTFGGTMSEYFIYRHCSPCGRHALVVFLLRGRNPVCDYTQSPIHNILSPSLQVVPPCSTHKRSAHCQFCPTCASTNLSWSTEEPLEHPVPSDPPKILRTNTQRIDRNSTS